MCINGFLLSFLFAPSVCYFLGFEGELAKLQLTVVGINFY